MSKYRYKAFISYSHADEAWARWLHRSIEAYRIPRKLVGVKTALGEVPARIKPVFRDRDELSTSTDLGSTVKQVLSDSENLIVICSPAAAKSLWVKQEIREFVRLGRRDRIFCVIVEGEASSSGSISEVFPDAIAEAGMQEPLAADIRKWSDGKQLARLKLIAGMLGLPLDQLRRRDLQKRRKFQALMLLAAAAVTTIIIIAISARMAAEQRRDSGELLVGYKLNELRTMLGEAGEPQNLDRLKQWDKAELAALINAAESQNSGLSEAALQLREEGIELWNGGDMITSMEKFRASWALFAEEYRRDRDNQAAFFELGQAEYWIGQVHNDRGEFRQAQTAFLSYAEITRQLILMQPKNAEWVLEMAYALTNLGRVQIAREGINPERTLQYMQSALEYNQIALVLDPDSDYYRSELGQSHANLAYAQLGVCDLEGALLSRREALSLESSLLDADSTNPDRQENLALALSGYARVESMRGLDDEAREHYQKALSLIQASARPDQRIRTVKLLAERKNLITWLDAMSGRIDEAWAQSEAQAEDWAELLEAGRDNMYTLKHYASYLLDRAWLANERGDTRLAADLLQQGLTLIATQAVRLPNSREIGNALTLAAYRYWQIKGEPPADDIVSMLPDYSTDTDRTRACEDADMAVRKAVLLGHPETAERLVGYLLDKGYAETGFMRVCRLYYDCPVESQPN
jgi:tetratricopeptide (TPR) repeat protein